MGRLILEGNPKVEVTLRRTAQARRLTLRVSRLDGRAVLTMPARVPEREGRAFLKEREGWLRAQLAALAPEERPLPGGTIPYRGGVLRLEPAEGARLRLSGESLLVPDDPARIGPRVAGFLKARARDALAEASDRYAAQLGCWFRRITLRDTRSRWGSCSSAGDLMYSWRLIMAPPEVLDYVAAHEVAHLRHMDHSPSFWAAVDGLFPDHRACRDWLRENGTALHRIRFD